MNTDPCEKYSELAAKVDGALRKLVEVTRAQREAFQRDDTNTFMRLDKELEFTVGEKERAIGALREHKQEHGCHR